MPHKDSRILTLEVGPLATCCYVLVGEDGSFAAVIDPGGDASSIIDMLTREKLDLEMILLTHSHYDHIGAVEELIDNYPSTCLACHPVCGERITDPIKNFSAPIMGVGQRVRAPGRTIANDEVFIAAGVDLRAIHVPGHAPGHLVYHAPGLSALFAGDTIFAGSIGRTDLPQGDHKLLVCGLRELLGSLPADTRIYPGHGHTTTVGDELKSNPFIA